MRKKMFTALIVMVMVIVFALSGTLYAQETDPVKVLTALADSLNAGYIDAAMALYAPDAVLNIVPPLPGLPGTFTGLKEIRGWLEILVGMNFKVEGVEILHVEGDKVNLRVKTSSDFARRLSIAFLEYTEEHIIQKGKIKGYTATITKESLEKLQVAISSYAEKEKVLNTFIERINAYDIDAVMELFTADAIITFVPAEVLLPGTFIGTEQVRAYMERLVPMNFKIQIEILQVVRDIAITRSKIWANGTPMQFIEIYPIQDGRIKGFIAIYAYRW